ncbi:cobaltochelatase subunit CobN [Paradevosia shaoguanensis]|uniref:Cobaltochelatase subunit CobN n=1 Tax=Paradevosia shaoguanensis TaxID=1335043 RepID=A0AA41QKD8_9HYPH|nr:cobaltochelatase subunit CobN [Paradevosia shaoguanensis]MCF1740850.1 cobaltochelatase subunit CobN [Paradevosia shaoguanensis]MCI0125334.1 cobaltochelatase subunit CobN [Paradevosia shaoguanensis]
MHLLAAQAGAIQQEGEAIDLNQSPGEIVFGTSADSELAMLAAATDRAAYKGLRLANLLKLSHNLSVDLWLDQTVQHAKLIVLRLIGGPAYWQYGVDEIYALAMRKNIPLVILSHDAVPDPVLRSRSTIAGEDWDRLLSLFVAGGPENADTLLEGFRLLATPNPTLPTGGREAVLADLATKPFARFGYWHPDLGMTDAAGLRTEHAQTSPSPLWGGNKGGGVPQAPNALPTPLPTSPARGEVPTGDVESGAPHNLDPNTSPLAGEAGRGVSPTHAHTPILFYRAALEGAGTGTLTALIAALTAAGLTPVPLVVSTLKEPSCVRFIKAALAEFPPAAILNLTGFALGLDSLDPSQNPFADTDAPVIQLLQSGRSREQWATDYQGLSAKDLAMLLVLPELDGRIGGLIVGHKESSVWHEATECALSSYSPDHDGIFRTATLAANYARLRSLSNADKRVALVLASYPIRDGRLANGVGYDAPESTVEILHAMAAAGYDLAGTSPSPLRGGDRGGGKPQPPATVQAPTLPLMGRAREGWSPIPSAATLIARLQSGPTNAAPARGEGIPFPLARYRALFSALPEKIRTEVTTRWGDPSADPFVRGENFHLPALTLGNVAILLQPSRGYSGDEALNFHDPDLVPPHAYLAAYLWLRHEFGAHALIHNGKHGNLEWLPGKGAALDVASYPDALWGQLPHLYPFIVNDPGEGTQAKRRTGATIIDHLTPPLTRAETYGPLKDLEALLDEYYAALGLDRRRLDDLRKRILDFTRDARLDRDIGLPEDENEALKTIDNFLCDLKEAQIRDGLHVFGRSPQGEMERDLIVALARVPRGDNSPADASLIRALADDLKLGFDPLTAKLGEPWSGPFILVDPPFIGPVKLRRVGDVVEALESIAAQLVEGTSAPAEWTATGAVLATVDTIIRPRLAASGPNEIKALLAGLDGKHVPPGPSGAPSRGRLDTLPTGRNFYSVDTRAVPTPTAWELGRKSAETLVLRHFQDHGTYLRSVALSVWGTANMRTGGDDIAQALALIGAKPQWDPSSLRVSGYEIIPMAKLGRPRVDVTLRISGLFRDAFPQQIALFDRAIRAIGALDEPEDQNPIASRMRTDALGLMSEGAGEAEAALRAGHRIFGSKPGTYGAGLNAMIDSGQWQTKADLAKTFLDWGQYAFGAQAAGLPERARFAARLSDIDAVVHNQDNREHDLLDSDDYYQFEGGLAAAAETLTGRQPAAYHLDHSRPENPVARTLEEEISRVMRSRVVNPKWIGGMMRHGYKGAFEIIATVDFMFAFAATTGAVKTHHFDLAFEAYVENDAVREFLQSANSFGYDELLNKFREALSRGLWTPRSNSAYAFLETGA